MEQAALIDFFNRCAPTWDAEMIRNEGVIRTILSNAGIRAGIDVLDVACGTGVLFPDYVSRGVASLTGIDISPEMADRAREKFSDATVICGDVETYPFERQFDVVMVYNAFPHFPEPKRLIERLAALAPAGGAAERPSAVEILQRGVAVVRRAVVGSDDEYGIIPDSLAPPLRRGEQGIR